MSFWLEAILSVEARILDDTLASTDDGNEEAVQLQLLLDVKSTLRKLYIDNWFEYDCRNICTLKS